MLRNYLIAAYRNLMKNRLSLGINLAGLSVGLACAMMLLLYVRFEQNYDHWVPDHENIYKIRAVINLPGRDPITTDGASARLAPMLRENFAQLDTALTLNTASVDVTVGDASFQAQAYFAEPDFLNFFPFDIAAGSKDALAEPASIVLTLEQAERFFGRTDIIGETLMVQGQALKVTAVLENLRRDTALDFQLLLPYDSLVSPRTEAQRQNWLAFSTHTYLKLKPGVPYALAEQEIAALMQRHGPPSPPGQAEDFFSQRFQHRLIPLTALANPASGPEGSITSDPTLLSVTIVAAMVLAMACANYVNLGLSQSLTRTREAALRMVLGADRKALVSQFLTESVLVALLALILAFGLVELTFAPLQNALGVAIEFRWTEAPIFLLSMVGISILIGLIAGLYPALRASSVPPQHILRPRSIRAQKTRLSQTLVVGQFSISIGLIICVLIVMAQTLFASRIDRGFETNDMIAIQTVGRSGTPLVSAAVVADRVSDLSFVEDSTLISTAIGLGFTVGQFKTITGDEYSAESLAVSNNSFELYGIRPIAGRLLTLDRAADVTTEEATQRNVVVTRKFTSLLGAATPEDAIDMVFTRTTGEDDMLFTYRVVGVVDDLLANIASPPEPTYFELVDQDNDNLRTVILKVDPDKAKRTEMSEALNTILDDLAAGGPRPDWFHTSDIFDGQTANQRRDLAIFGAGAGLAVLIACLGLFGLASFSAKSRVREIGVRKVLGARVSDVVRLMLWQFSMPVLIANLIAWPIAWYVMHDWLSDFATRISLTPLPFLLAGVVGLLIAWATVAGWAVSTARTNPIYALRYE